MYLTGKSKSLVKLKESGFNVPFFVVIGQNQCNSETIKNILQKEFSTTKLFAVRSSFSNEDGVNKSFAGYFYSALGVSKENIISECNKVISSYKGGEGDIILQEFIPSTNSGVVFSNAGNNKMIINSNFGLCESVVKGKPCDEYIIDNIKGVIISEKITKEKEVINFIDNNFQYFKTSKKSLNKKQIEKLIKISSKIEELFKIPQDIEFCFLDEELFILQSRPITKSVYSDNVLNFYDSANIAESYSGIVLPLTLSFVKLVYSEVYKDLVAASGISRKKIEKNKIIFDSLTSSYFGRLYYNMNNWYHMMSFFPGYKRNKKNLELMISSNIKNEITRKIKPGFFFSVFYYFLIILKFIFFPIIVFYFKFKTKKALKRYSKLPIEQMTLNQCNNLFQSLLSGVLKKWYIAIENDTVLMTLLGKLHLKNKNIFNNINITSNTVSANQVQELKKLADILYKDNKIKKTLDNKNKEQFFVNLVKNQQAKDLYDQYFMIYGGRFANELKLESEDLKENFMKFSALIKVYNKTHFIKPKFNNISKENNLLIYLIRFFATNREEMRLLRSNMFSVVRSIFIRIGIIFKEKNYIKESEDIFYLSIEEVLNKSGDFEQLSEIIKKRKEEYDKYVSIFPPSHFSLNEGENLKIITKQDLFDERKTLEGSSSSLGNVSGKVRVFSEFFIPDPIDFDILVTSHTDPGWVPLIGLSKGLIIEHGGILSHASIVSRELGIPSVVGVKNATRILKTGDFVEIDGQKGSIIIKTN